MLLQSTNLESIVEAVLATPPKASIEKEIIST